MSNTNEASVEYEPEAAMSGALAPDVAQLNAPSAVNARSGPRVLALPATRSGWAAFGLEVAFVILFVAAAVIHSPSTQTALWGQLETVNRVMLFVTPVAVALALVGGVLAVAALVRKRERSILVWFAAAIFVGAALVIVTSLV